MQLKKLSASFGKLNHNTLSLASGLNIVYAPNESGKSTWTAFLRVMLYGLNTRDRSVTAEKRLYLPWNGQPMEGSIELTDGSESITLHRFTSRASSPMGSFSAVYTGTSEPVPHLTATNCGQALLGVPEEVYQRSAYIRQSGIAFDHHASLEQRIAALITTGEEDTSYTESYERLKKLRNHCRYNKSGTLPKLEEEIARLRDKQEECRILQATIQKDLEKQATLSAQIRQTQQLLADHERADLAQCAAEGTAAQTALDEALKAVNRLEQVIAQMPERSQLELLRGRIAARDSAKQSLQQQRTAVLEAEALLQSATAKRDAHPLFGQTHPPVAEVLPPQSRHILPLSLFSALLVGAGLYFVHPLVAVGGAIVLWLLLFLWLRRRYRQQLAVYQSAAEQQQALLQQYNDYCDLCRNADEAEVALRSANAVWDATKQAWDAEQQALLQQLRQFSTSLDLSQGASALDKALACHDRYRQAQADLQTAHYRRSLYPDVLPEMTSVERPTVSRESLNTLLSQQNEELTALRHRLHTAQGRLQITPEELSAEIADLEAQHREQQLRYHALTLAMDTLEDANRQLQQRFSPALGEEATSIFTKLTRGKYNRVYLRRELTPSAQEAGAFTPHEPYELSHGTAEQLYLAVRLAISRLVLPPSVPLILDDALVTFDDNRMAAALDYLVALSQERQILLFTCQKRELDYLRTAHAHAFHLVSPWSDNDCIG